MKSVIALLPCEVAARAIIPSIRAAVAKILVEEHKIPRYKAARLLNMTPAAITNYLEGRRGNKFLDRILNDPELLAIVRRMSEMLAREAQGKERYSDMEYQRIICTICSTVNPLIEDREAHLSMALSRHAGSRGE